MTEYQLPKAYDFKTTEPRIYAIVGKRWLFQAVQRPE